MAPTRSLFQTLALSLACVAGLSGAAVWTGSAVAAEPMPMPEFGVLDLAEVLPLPILKATERVLREHQELTQETIFVVTFPNEKRLDTTAMAFLEAWHMETPKPPNVVLLAVDADRGDLAIVSGLGFDAIIGAGGTQAFQRKSEIRKVFFDPEWKSGKKNRALVLAIVETLRTLDSPMITSGEAVDAFERAGFTGGWRPIVPIPKTSTPWIWMTVGSLFFGFILYRILAVETHSTGEGWHRIPATEVLTRRFRKLKGVPPLLTGGGVSGQY